MAETAAQAGWVDTHNHILFGLDDGAKRLEDSLDIAAAARADGITHIVCTPHANFQYEFSPARVAEALAAVTAALGEAGPRLMPGCEMHLTYDNVQHALREPAAYTLNRSRYLLVEFPEFFEPNSVGGILSQLQRAELVPVLAHPERNAVFHAHPEVLERYVEMGCITQITASSFDGRFGRQAQQFSAQLLKRNLVHIAASDAHSVRGRPPQVSGAFHYIASHQDEAIARQICSANPLAIAENRKLPYLPAVRAAKKGLLGALFGR